MLLYLLILMNRICARVCVVVGVRGGGGGEEGDGVCSVWGGGRNPLHRNRVNY